MPFIAALLLAAAAFFGWKHWKHKAAESWPKAIASFEDGALDVWTDEDIEHFSVWIEFKYHVAGESFRGRYEKSLIGYGRKDAEQLLESFRHGPLYARYLPSKPQVYVCDPFRDVRP